MNPNSRDPQADAKNQKGEEKIPIDGFQQIVEMLRVADPAFRDSLLKRLAARDGALAASLRRDLNHR